MENNKCPACGSPLMLLASQNRKLCYGKSCRKLYDWNLKEGQMPMIKHQRG